MDIEAIIQNLLSAADSLDKSLEMEWRFAVKPPRNPVQARISKAWPVWGKQTGSEVWLASERMPMRKHGPNWFYCDFTFPSTWKGLKTAGDTGYIFFSGFCPFTLYIDGEEIFREEHVWHATGPIGDPIVTVIEEGKTYRLVMNFEPTELPSGFNPLSMKIVPKQVLAMAAQVGAAGSGLTFAWQLARSEAERSLIVKAAEKIDLNALDTFCWPKVLPSLAKMEEMLLPFSERIKEHTVHLLGHTHIDMDWQWTWKDTVHCIRRDYQATLDLLDDYPEVKFSMSQIPTYEVTRKMDPKNFQRVQKLIQSDRWENLASTWVEGDLDMADGESLARQYLYAAEWSHEHLGKVSKVMWAPDTFGHPGNMPQISRLGGCEIYFHWRCNPGGQDFWPVRIWEGIDGTTIPAYTSTFGGTTTPGTSEFVMFYESLKYLRLGFRNMHHVFGCGDHGGGLARHHMWCLEQFRDKPLIPTLRFSTLEELNDAVMAEKNEKVPTNKGETYQIFKGCYTSHALQKQYNRDCERELLAAETAAAMAGIRPVDSLRQAWTPVLFNQFHDIFDGAAVPDSYEDTYRRARKSIRTARKVQEAALSELAVKKGGSHLTLLNLNGHAYGDVIRTKLPRTVRALVAGSGETLPVQHEDGRSAFVCPELPAFGLSSLALKTGKGRIGEPNPITVTETGEYFKVETSRYRALVSKANGTVAGYYDKASDCEMVACGEPRPISHIHVTRQDLALNLFQIIDESPNGMSAWHIHDILREENLVRGAEVTLAACGPVFASVQVKHRFRNSCIEETIYFYAHTGRIDFEADIDWREPGNPEVGVPQLKVSFGTRLTAPRSFYEGPYTTGERPADGMEKATQKWAAIRGEEGGFALYNDARYGYDALGSRLRISLLRNSYFPDPDSDNGRHHVRFAFEPLSSSTPMGELVRRAMDFNRPPLLRRTGAAVDASSLLELGGDRNVVVTSLRPALHSDNLILTLFEAEGRTGRATLQSGRTLQSVQPVNFLEEKLKGRISRRKGTWTMDFRPYEIKCLSVKMSVE